MASSIIEEAEAIMSSVDIPSYPQVLMNIYNEVMKPEPSFSVLKVLASQDIALSAKTVKFANSAFFGLRYKVNSIEHALTVLGLENFTNIVAATVMKEDLFKAQQSVYEFEEFFLHSMYVARIAQYITHKIHVFSGGIIYPSQTYMAGLFHDCGIMILYKKYPDYFKKITEASENGGSLIDIEESLYKTNHSVVGYLVARSWQLPDSICKIIRNHHIIDIDSFQDVTLKIMLSINVLSEWILTDFVENENELSKIIGIHIVDEQLHNLLMSKLDFDEEDFKDIISTVNELILQE